jgi:NADPH-dependent 2,4-dienoyl-CoA reductase/sulfur reductase-like enzyme
MSAHTDILIIGAGPAGLSAALAAAPSGARIVLVDDNPLAGGQIWRDGALPDGSPAKIPAHARQLRERVRACANVEHLAATKVIARSGERQLLLENAERGWTLSYDALILCTGARELLLPFPGWTLPGVTGAGGLQALIKGGLPVAGERLLIAGSGPLLLASAATASQQGARIVRIAEQASRAAVAGLAMRLPRWPGKLLQSLTLGNRHYRTASHVLEAYGDGRLEGVRLLQGGRPVDLACDRLACGFGLVANVELGLALSYGVRQDPLQGPVLAVDAWQRSPLPGHFAAGECTGPGGSERAMIEGAIAGLAASGDRNGAARLAPRRAHWQGFAEAVARAFALDPALKTLARPDTLLCRCEDVPYAAVAGHADWRQAKLASRCGMGACQGRICGAATAHLFGWAPAVPRAPFSPARAETLLCVEDDGPR